MEARGEQKETRERRGKGGVKDEVGMGGVSDR